MALQTVSTSELVRPAYTSAMALPKILSQGKDEAIAMKQFDVQEGIIAVHLPYDRSSIQHVSASHVL